MFIINILQLHRDFAVFGEKLCLETIRLYQESAFDMLHKPLTPCAG